MVKCDVHDTLGDDDDNLQPYSGNHFCRFHLGRIHQCMHRSDRAKECMMYALDLENTQPIQPFSILPVYI